MSKSKKKSPEEQARENFTSNKVFVMTRPDEQNEGLLSIQTEKDATDDEEIKELYGLAFFDYVMNLSGILSKAENMMVLQMITPTLAYQFFLEDAEQAQSIITNFLQQNETSKGIEFIKKMPDAISQLEFVLKENFVHFSNDYKKIGLEKSLQKHHHFYVDMEELFFSLPACYCFNLIDFCETLGKNKKKKNSKSEK